MPLQHLMALGKSYSFIYLFILIYLFDLGKIYNWGKSIHNETIKDDMFEINLLTFTCPLMRLT